MAPKGFSLPAMVVELNHTIRRDLPSHRFVAATLVNLDAAAGAIEVWNGGNPAAFLIGATGAVTEAWTSSHLPLGVVDSDELDPRPDTRLLHAESELVLFSDGAIEALDEQGLAFGEATLLRTLAETPAGARLEALKFAIVEHLAGRAAGDDVTLVLLDCGAELRQALACPTLSVANMPTGVSDMHPGDESPPCAPPLLSAMAAWTLQASACES
jgi:serine phosphatase RsbU (regulator of sigma subunit)